VKQNYNPTGSLGSKKNGTSKYLDTVSKYKKSRSPTSSIATSVEQRSHTSIRSTRSWKTNKIPTEIDFSEDNFPTMAHKSESPITTASERLTPIQPMQYLEAVQGRTQGHLSTHGGYGSFKPVIPRTMTADNNDQTESSITIQSAISQALAEARQDHMKMITLQQEAHRKEIEQLTKTFQAQMQMLELNFKQGKNQPDRMEYLEDKMERTSNQMDARLDKIINLLLHTHDTNATTGPSPFRKKTRHDPNNETDMEVDHFNQNINDSHEAERHDTQITPISTSPTRGHDQTPPTTTTNSPARNNPETTPLPDSPNQEDTTWLKRQTTTQQAFTEKAKALLNPYRTAHETLKSQLKSSRKSLLNASSPPIGVQLTTLSSSRSDIASRGRE